MDATTTQLRDLPRWFWLGIPLGYYCIRYLWFYLAQAGIVPSGHAFFGGETGFVESLSAIALWAAAGFGIALLIQHWQSFSAKARVLLICYTLGCFFMGGEEMSWGQHYFKWSTPDHFNNVQNETNLHNSELMMKTFNRLRLLLGHLITLFGAVYPIYRLIRKKPLVPDQHHWWWFWPSYVCIPVGILALIANLPNDINRMFGTEIPVFHGRGEFKESFIALFFIIFSCSLYYRLKWMTNDQYAWRS